MVSSLSRVGLLRVLSECQVPKKVLESSSRPSLQSQTPVLPATPLDSFGFGAAALRSPGNLMQEESISKVNEASLDMASLKVKLQMRALWSGWRSLLGAGGSQDV